MTVHKDVAVADQAGFLADLLTKLVADGWTQDQSLADADNSIIAFHKDTVYVQLRMDGTSIGVYQSLGFSGTGVSPGNHTDDSGNGVVGATNLNNGRSLNDIGDSFTSYSMFTGGAGATWVHVCLQYQPGLYRWLSFGDMGTTKVGGWVGGAFCGGHRWFSTNEQDPTSQTHALPWDSLTSQQSWAGTIHLEDHVTPNIPSTPPSQSKWGLFKNQENSGTRATGNDRSGLLRTECAAHLRHGWEPYAWSHYAINPQADANNLIPINVYANLNRSGGGFETPSGASPFNSGQIRDFRELGTIPGIFLVNMELIVPGAQITEGVDEYTVYPWVRKQYNGTGAESWNAGLAVLNVT